MSGPYLPLLAVATLLTSQSAGIRIITDPVEAEVWHGEIRLGVAGSDGLLLADIPPGKFEITLRKPGFQEVRRTLTVSEGRGTDPLTVLIRLIPASGEPATLPAPPSPSATVSPGTRQPRAEARPQDTQRAADPKGKKRSGPGPGTVALIAGGAAAVALGAAVALKKDPLEIDDDHDGFSEKAGDCNDQDRDVSPSGQFSVSVNTYATDTVNCRSSHAPIEVFATNLSCSAVSITSVTLVEAVTSGRCFGGSQFQIPVVSSSVASAARNHLIARRQFGGTVGCCINGFCGSNGFSCGLVSQYSVQTSAGSRAATFNYVISFPPGFSCPACTSAFGDSSLEKACRPQPFEPFK